MNQKLNNWQQKLDDEAVDEYNALRRSLQRNDGFGLFFVQCSPAIGENILAGIKEDISRKRIEILRLTEPVDSLYNLIIDLPNIDNIDILFVSGLEHSLYEYEQYTFDNIDQETYVTSRERYSQSRRGVPRFLGYLNLQRDRFREYFDISFVFLLPSFGINYFIKRAPDFFDWRSGLFKFIPRKDNLTDTNFDSIFQEKSKKSLYELLELKTLSKELELSDKEQAKLANKQFLLSINSQRYEDAVKYLDLWLEYNKDNYQAWYNRGLVLDQIERYEEAVASYNKALELKSDNDSVWYNRGNALRNLGRYEEAVESYDRALKLNSENCPTYHDLGYTLELLV